MGQATFEFTDANFEAEAVGQSMPVLVDFWATWCGPCRAQTPIVEELATDLGDTARIGKLNVDDNPMTAQKYQVRSIPTILILHQGAVKKQFVGLRGKDELASAIRELL